ncbi:hypothetical protein BBK14_15670 [Parafrankia soli]|uniref:Uncharacterized protein n=1 Tax=Parafrankia soli TaxID=2599596 RepID=A0A1S1QI17_9ACTN|nr:hypothetical protein [Parafrankia soli]OHV33229.1 hypothetical protein BBK14_15670 [Parafrankia soli]
MRRPNRSSPSLGRERTPPPTEPGWVQGYNAQLVVTDDYLVLAHTVTQDTNDTAWFVPMTEAALATAATAATVAPVRDPAG